MDTIYTSCRTADRPKEQHVSQLPAVTAVVPSNGLERNSALVVLARMFTVPILNSLPGSMIKRLMVGTSYDASAVVANGGTAHALEAMYTRHHRSLFSRGIAQGLADLFWHHAISQPKAVRNRLRLVRQIVKKEAIAILESKRTLGDAEPLRILSIASGSSRSIIQTVVDLKTEGWLSDIQAVTVDKDQSALDIGAHLAREAGVEDRFQWICGSTTELAKLLPGTRFDIIEVVGLLDYFSSVRVVRLLRESHNMLNDGGVLVAANVMPNPEIPFVHKTGWPRMVYRSPESFRALFETCGFASTTQTIEPLRVHCIVLARK